MKKKMLNSSGFGRKETMLCLLLLIIFAVIVLNKFVGTKDQHKFDNFRRLASNFAENAGRMRNEELAYENGAYLYDVIKEYYGNELTSPFDGSETCDVYESRIESDNTRTLVTLKCSEYLIYREVTTAKEFSVYKVSEWTDEQLSGDNVQSETFYNYEIDGKQQLDKFYNEKEFIEKYYELTGKKITSPNNLNNYHQLVEKTYYRTLDKVD